MNKTNTSANIANSQGTEPDKGRPAADPDARPLMPADLKRMRRTPQTKMIRRALELTQEEFSKRYHIPLGTLRDWEQGRSKPDEAALAFLTLIAREPEHVDLVLNRRSSGRFFMGEKG